MECAYIGQPHRAPLHPAQTRLAIFAIFSSTLNPSRPNKKHSFVFLLYLPSVTPSIRFPFSKAQQKARDLIDLTARYGTRCEHIYESGII